MHRTFSVQHEDRKSSEAPKGLYHIVWNGRRQSGGYTDGEKAQQICDAWNADPVMLQQLRNARFWIYLRNGWAKITLEPGQKLTRGYSGSDEEGGWYNGHTLEHQGYVISHSGSNGGRDCDGPHHHPFAYVCELENLHAVNAGDPGGPAKGYGPGAPVPLWVDEKEYYRNQEQ